MPVYCDGAVIGGLRVTACEITGSVALLLLLSTEAIDGCCDKVSPSIPVTFTLFHLVMLLAGPSVHDILEVKLFVPFLTK
jgi:hypothetical protein